MRRVLPISASETTSAIAWQHLAIADLDDHAGGDPSDLHPRSAIRASLHAAYAAGARAVSHDSECDTAPELVAVLDAVLEVTP